MPLNPLLRQSLFAILLGLFLVACAEVSRLIPPAPTATATATAEPQVLNMANWDTYMRRDLLAPLNKENIPNFKAKSEL